MFWAKIFLKFGQEKNMIVLSNLPQSMADNCKTITYNYLKRLIQNRASWIVTSKYSQRSKIINYKIIMAIIFLEYKNIGMNVNILIRLIQTHYPSKNYSTPHRHTLLHLTHHISMLSM